MKDRVVILKSFLGTRNPKKDTEERENYWKLIGQRGRIVDDQGMKDRVLVLFENNLDDYKLENHNPIKNTLWVKTSDLEFEEQ